MVEVTGISGGAISLMPVPEDAVVFELPVTSRSAAPEREQVRQYLCEIREDPEGNELLDALSGALDSFREDHGVNSKFTLWIKGRRFGSFPLALEEHDRILDDIYHIVDLEIAFNRHEWSYRAPN